MRRLTALALLSLVSGACHPPASHAPPSGDNAQRAAMRVSQTKPEAAPRPLVRCFHEDAPGDPPRQLDALLDQAADRYDHGDFVGSLGCAEEAARVDPSSVEAHHDRAAALQELGRLDEAEAAFARALALDPDDPETLAGAADLYINRLAASNDHTETGLAYAQRGSRRVRRSRSRGDHQLVARLALLEGQALNDLGRSREALDRCDAALLATPGDPHAEYERAVALFDLCRFHEAKRGFLDVLARNPHDAWAHHQLGLTLERLGDSLGAQRELARAQREAPSDFRPPVMVSPTEFRAMVDAEVKKLSPGLRTDLAQVQLQTEDLPELADLTAEEPPLAPTILGLFRGSPLGEAPDGGPRAIVIYRKNLARAVASRQELEQQIRTTLLHELGHLRGEDDDALRARGLE